MRRLGGEEANSQSVVEEEDGLEMGSLKLPSFERIDYSYEESRVPKDYLSELSGDVILCQSSLKLLTIYDRYTEVLSFAPTTGVQTEGIEHLLIITEYYVPLPQYRSIIFSLPSWEAPTNDSSMNRSTPKLPSKNSTPRKD